MSSVVPSESESTTAACYVSGASAGASTTQEMIPGDATEFARWFQGQFPTIPFRSALAVIRLAADKATVPFIARYRKEQTGNLDEVAIGNTIDALSKWKSLVERKAFILSEIDAQGKLTPELKGQITILYRGYSKNLTQRLTS